MTRRLALVLLASFTSCVAPDPGFGGPYLDHEEVSDFALVSGTFDRNNVVTDNFFTAGTAMSAADIQRFLERTPYGNRCFLADHRNASGTTAAEAIAAAAAEHDVNPLLLLARLQVEKSLMSKTTRPSQRSVDFALGCGCPDGSACSEAQRGFDRQLECGASVHDRWFDASIAGTGSWRRGVRRTSSDGLGVTPANHATASLYAYTPWVLQGRGGNWLVWSVVKKFVNHAIAQGLATAAELDGGAGGGPSAPAARWIGSACAMDSDCAGLGLTGQKCHLTGEGAGFCTSTCEGTCPDRSGFAVTFCVSLDDGATGSCVPKSAAENMSCRAVPGTEPIASARFVGRSGRPAATATACIPTSAPEVCENTCSFSRDGVCDDGGSGASFSECPLGSDCADCGTR